MNRDLYKPVLRTGTGLAATVQVVYCYSETSYTMTAVREGSICYVFANYEKNYFHESSVQCIRYAFGRCNAYTTTSFSAIFCSVPWSGSLVLIHYNQMPEVST